MSRPCIEVAMEVEEEKFFLLVVQSRPGDIQQRSYVQRGKPRSIIGSLRYTIHIIYMYVSTAIFSYLWAIYGKLASACFNYFNYS